VRAMILNGSDRQHHHGLPLRHLAVVRISPVQPTVLRHVTSRYV
jgi:hypothetical protein